MTTRELIRDATALGALEVFREIGVLIDLKHEDDAVVSGLISYIINTGQGIYNQPAQQSIIKQLTFVIPRQPNFDGTVRVSDLIYFPSGSNDVFSVVNIEIDELGAIYRVQARKMESPASI